MTKGKSSPPKTRAVSKKPSLLPTVAETIEQLEEDNQQLTQQLTQEVFLEQLSKFKIDIVSLLENQKNEIIDKLTKENGLLKAEITELREKFNVKETELFDVERDVVNLQQYVRRNNIEFCGIPDKVKSIDLQQKVIDIAKSINVEIAPVDIEACHRLHKGKKDSTARTIVRFVNRKHCDRLHANKSKLKNVDLSEFGIRNDVYINCNLCPYNKFLWGKCKKLYNEKLIDRFWVYNGCVYFASDENDNGTKISHLEDLKKIFPGYDFYTKF